MPYTIYHIQYTIYHIPYTIYHTQYTIYHTPHTIYYIPYTTYHIPFTIYHITVKSQLPVAPRFATCTYDPYTTMMKITIDFVKTSTLSTVTHHCQITVVTRMNVSHARMTYIPSTMMKMTIDSVQTSSISTVTHHCQITVVGMCHMHV